MLEPHNFARLWPSTSATINGSSTANCLKCQSPLGCNSSGVNAARVMDISRIACLRRKVFAQTFALLLLGRPSGLHAFLGSELDASHEALPEHFCLLTVLCSHDCIGRNTIQKFEQCIRTVWFAILQPQHDCSSNMIRICMIKDGIHQLIRTIGVYESGVPQKGVQVQVASEGVALLRLSLWKMLPWASQRPAPKLGHF
jgi:hypothetical protein